MTIHLFFNLLFQEFLKRSWSVDTDFPSNFQASFAPPNQKVGCFVLNFVETTILNVFFQNITLQVTIHLFLNLLFQEFLKRSWNRFHFQLSSFAPRPPESKSRLFCFEFCQNNNFECLFPNYYIAMTSSINFRMSRDRFPPMSIELSRDSGNRCFFV